MLLRYYLVQVWPFEGLLSDPSLFFNTVCQQKNTVNLGFSTFINKKGFVHKFQRLLSGPSLRFLKRTQLGPDGNPYLDQTIPPQNVFFAFNNVLKYLFIQCFLDFGFESSRLRLLVSPLVDNPEVLQSSFWLSFFILVWRIIGIWPAIPQRILRHMFPTKSSLGLQDPPKTYPQNSRPKSSAFL